MQQLALEQRRLLGPRAPWHVGDVAWGLRQHEGREPSGRSDSGGTATGRRVVVAEGGRPARASTSSRTGTTCSTRSSPSPTHARPSRSKTMSSSAQHSRATASCTRASGCISSCRELAEQPAPAPLPHGFRCRTVEPADVAERVAIHRDVWAPSRVTESSYRNVMAEWPYRSSLDCVVEAPDGRFAGYCLMWPDDENRVGELEPVGVREEFRRLGVGAAAPGRATAPRPSEGGSGRAIRSTASPGALGRGALYESIRLPHPSRTIVGYAMPNRLAQETSPYLLQHAENPVDWYPWGDEAFARARGRGQADPALGRLLGLPLVPRDGARVVRGRRRRRGDERAASSTSRSTARSGPTSTRSTWTRCSADAATAAGR